MLPKRPLLPLSFGIVLIPCFIQMYLLTEPGYSVYILRVLCLLALIVAGLFVSAEAPLMALAAVQIVYAAWLCSDVGGLTTIAAVSPIILYFQLPRPSSRWLLLCIHLAALNIALYGQPPEWIAVCNLFMLCFSVLLELLRHTTTKNKSTEFLYDALRKKHYELDETRTRQLLYTKQVEEAAQAEERSRISRQLHDDVGHRLIRAKMMMEAVIQIMPTDQEKGMVMLRQIRDQLTSGLDEMRAAVRRLKPSEPPAGILALGSMLEEVGRETGIRTDLTIEGNPYTLYPSQEIILYKNAREAVTNALKHGHPVSVNIVITYKDHEICMTVCNDGVIPEVMPKEDSGGLGLIGMRERCTLAGGRLEITMEPMFTITTRLPVTHHQDIH